MRPFRRSPLFVPVEPPSPAEIVPPVLANVPPEPLPERSGGGEITTFDGLPLPILPGVRWERHTRGGWEAWHLADETTTHRRGKIYLGYFGVRALRTATPESIRDWIEQKRAEKGIET